MAEAFAAAFSGTLSAVAGIFLVIVCAGLLVRRGVITQAHVDGLSAATVKIFLPCLIFAKVVGTLQPADISRLWILPLAGFGMALAGTGLGVIAFLGQLPQKRNLLPAAGMQNAGYLVLPVGLALFPEQFDTFALYCFLFILGFNPVLWSLGKVLISGNGGEPLRWRGLVTPPLVASLAAIVTVLSRADALIPGPLLSAVDLVGSAAVPVATFVLGAVLGSVQVRIRHHFADALRAIAVKLVLLPALTVAALHFSGLRAANPLLAEFFVIEAGVAPAVALILQVRTYGGDERAIGTVMVISYAACTLSLPTWVAIWSVMIT